MNNIKQIGIVVVFVLALAVLFVRYGASETEASPAVVAFAQCLATKNITMYGAEWCPHCQNEKRAFGNAFRYVPYVECPDNPQACVAKGVDGYPTWIFPDGRKLVGEQGLKKLSEESGCVLVDASRSE